MPRSKKLQKLQNAQTMREQVAKDKERQKEKLDGLKKDLAIVKKDADAAQGAQLSSSIKQYFIFLIMLHS
jgi:structural maintenance of chromosome 1